MAPVWIWSLLRLLALLGLGAVLGSLAGSAAAGMLVVALAVLALNLYYLYRLERWLVDGEEPRIPDGKGVWARVFAQVVISRLRAKRRGKRFRRLLKELRASTEAFPDGGIVLNANLEIINYNEAARRLLGLRKRLDKGQRIDRLLRHPDFVSYLTNPGQRPSVQIPAPVGNNVWLSCWLIPYGPGQQLLLLRDITQGLKLERMRRDFVANASHELRSPLTVVSGYLEAMAEDPELATQWQQPLAVMQEQSLRMRRLIEDLLHLSTLESDTSVPLEQSVDVGGIISTVAKGAVQLVAEPAAIEVAIESAAGLLGEENEIHSIVSNLVANAVRYTPGNGRITIKWSTDAAGGHLAVTDTGIGIAAEEVPRVTERFYRTDAGRVRQRGGTGLGLAIVKHALRRHDAELEIHSQLGQGSSFICHFPPERVAEA